MICLFIKALFFFVFEAVGIFDTKPTDKNS